MDALTCDATGWVAATLTACCFASTRMLSLRALALSANLAFIAYGSLAGLAPVLALHLMLAPLNAWHLLRQWHAAQPDRVPTPCPKLQRRLTTPRGSVARPACRQRVPMRRACALLRGRCDGCKASKHRLHRPDAPAWRAWLVKVARAKA